MLFFLIFALFSSPFHPHAYTLGARAMFTTRACVMFEFELLPFFTVIVVARIFVL